MDWGFLGHAGKAYITQPDNQALASSFEAPETGRRSPFKSTFMGQCLQQGGKSRDSEGGGTAGPEVLDVIS